ncbi:DUF1559 family PulG-like putative transporter [Stratiformator vulcanicus]|uniref:DUF1559 domain-containing protein n=1 Tax=Stratiformator vulcanicus TaxID=2527980 RepID=A0A517QWZ3_9PLAN|nr:DUF1559 domain-containing protein [Stratiformator vulcanicus]QDT36182.1 hypothetical protein Pan189_05370 [Stratiformator vulcanicus]
MKHERSESADGRPIGCYAVALLTGVSLVCLIVFLPPIEQSRGAARHSMCRNNLKRIGLALHYYNQEWGSLPPAATYGPDGQPWHSWRALILPQMTGQNMHGAASSQLDEVAEAYRFDEPWDGPHNRELHAIEVRDFRCPEDPPRQPEPGHQSDASYLAVVGPGTMFPPDAAESVSAAHDDLTETILLVERFDSRVHWMQPFDLNDSDLIPKRDGKGMRSYHAEGINVLMADGSAQCLSKNIREESLRNLLLRNK